MFERSNIRLRPMRADEWDAWRAFTVREYADEMVRNKDVSAEEAFARAGQETDELLTEGLETADHHLYVAEEVGSGVRLGHAWFGPRARNPDDAVAWLYDIFVEESARGRGVGRTIMHLLEVEGRILGKHRVELNVFGDNAPAKRLYDAMGYVEMTRQMGKDLDSSLGSSGAD